MLPLWLERPDEPFVGTCRLDRLVDIQDGRISSETFLALDRLEDPKA